MPDQFRIARYRAEDRERVFDLLRAVHRPDLADRLIRQWNWKYDGNPFNAEAARYRDAHREEVLAFMYRAFTRERFEKFCRKWSINPDEGVGDAGPYILLTKNGDEVVGMQGSIPLRYMVGGKERWITTGGDLAIHPGYRNRGFALPLTNRLLNEHAMMVSWFNESIHRIRTGWRKAVSRARRPSAVTRLPEARLRPLTKPVDPGYAVRALIGNGMLGGATATIAAAAQPFVRLLTRPLTSVEVSVIEIDTPDDDLEQLWNRVRDSHAIIGVRDRRFLNWRFVQRPDSSYRFLVAMRGSMAIGYLVFRLAEIDGERHGYLVDFLVQAPAREAFRLLLSRAEERLIDAGAKVIVCGVASAPYRRALMRSGYLPWRTRKAVYLAANLNSADPELRAFVDLPQWFVTMADGDLEMSL
jgi:hypothetical protein